MKRSEMLSLSLGGLVSRVIENLHLWVIEYLPHGAKGESMWPADGDMP
jgi:hypothetical protein